MEQKSYTVVPNWDSSCSNLGGKNFRIKYDVTNPTDYPTKIMPFRNTFNGDDVLQLCAWGRVYACTSHRPCDIAFGPAYQDSTDSAYTFTSSIKIAQNIGSMGMFPWLDSTNLDVLGTV